MVEASGGAQGDVAGFGYAVGADAVVVVVGAVSWGGFGSGLVGGGWGCLVGQCSVGSAVVVGVDELVEQCLELGQAAGAG